jgi:DNA-directed RNA polymerase subunit RPC12/RpoP
MHEFSRIFTNVQVGSQVSIGVIGATSGSDQVFTITGTKVLDIMNRPFVCWVMTSPQGSMAYYDTYSGILVNGTFYYKVYGSTFYYSIQVTGTNATLAPNAHVPAIAPATVTPIVGNSTTTFVFNATYTDLDDNASAFMNLVVNGPQFDNVTIPMLLGIPNDTSFSTGVPYFYSLTYLRPGNYTFYFTCSDGEFTNTTVAQTLTVLLQSAHSPFFEDISVNPPSGTIGPANFTFSATYIDVDNNAPASFAVVINGTSHTMAQVNPNDTFYFAGCAFTSTVSLEPGNYSYYFTASDSMHANSTTTYLLVVNVQPVNKPWSFLGFLGSTAGIITIAIIAAGVVVVVAVVTVKRKKSRTAVSPKIKQPRSIRAAPSKGKTLTDTFQSKTAVPPPGAYGMAPAAVTATATLPANYMCDACGQQLQLQAVDPARTYTCPVCQQPMLRILACPHCGAPMSLPQDEVSKYMGSEMQCPSCQKVFVV